MPNRFRFRSRPNRRSVSTTDTFETDVTRQQPAPATMQAVEPSKARAAIRVMTTAAETVGGPSRAAMRLVDRTERIRHRLQGHRIHVVHRLRDPRMLKARAGIRNEIADSTYAWGAIVCWIPALVALAPKAAFVVNDSTFMYSTARNLLDVPAHVPWYSAGPGWTNYFALGAAVLITGVLFVAVQHGAHTIAWWKDPSFRASKTGEDTPGGQVRKFVPRWSTFSVALLVIAGLSWVMHALAEARLQGQLFSNATDATNALTWFVTGIPFLMLVSEALAANPRFIQGRRIHRAAAAQRSYEFWSVRWERWLEKAYRRHYARAEQATVRVIDTARLVSLRGDYEIAGAGIATGIDVAGQEVADLTSLIRGDRKIRLADRPVSRYLGPGEVSGRVSVLVHRFNELPAPRVDRVTGQAWLAFKSGQRPADVEGGPTGSGDARPFEPGIGGAAESGISSPAESSVTSPGEQEGVSWVHTSVNGSQVLPAGSSNPSR